MATRISLPTPAFMPPPAPTPAPCFVYVLGSPARRRTYVGWTVNLERRLERHNAGTGAKATRGAHWLLLYAEKHPTRALAMGREWHLKRDRALRRALAAALASHAP